MAAGPASVTKVIQRATSLLTGRPQPLLAAMRTAVAHRRARKKFLSSADASTSPIPP
jgi:hypothetical protein